MPQDKGWPRQPKIGANLLRHGSATAPRKSRRRRCRRSRDGPWARVRPCRDSPCSDRHVRQLLTSRPVGLRFAERRLSIILPRERADRAGVGVCFRCSPNRRRLAAAVDLTCERGTSTHSYNRGDDAATASIRLIPISTSPVRRRQHRRQPGRRRYTPSTLLRTTPVLRCKTVAPQMARMTTAPCPQRVPNSPKCRFRAFRVFSVARLVSQTIRLVELAEWLVDVSEASHTVGEGAVLYLANTRQMTGGRGRHEPDGWGVLLIRKTARLDGTFLYRRDWLPDLGDEIEVVEPGGISVQATVTGLEKTKSLPIRAAER